jgi:hypothetical protein
VRGDLLARLHPRRLAGHLRVVGRVVELDLALIAPEVEERLAGFDDVSEATFLWVRRLP